MSETVYWIIAVLLFPIMWPITIFLMNKTNPPFEEEHVDYKIYSLSCLLIAIAATALWVVSITLLLACLVGRCFIKPINKFTSFVSKIEKLLRDKDEK